MWTSRLPLMVAVVLATPSANYQVFDGLPLGSLPEYLLLIGLLPLLVHRGVRSVCARWLRQRRRLAAGLWTAALVALLLKVVLFAAGDYAGLQACYGTPLSSPPFGNCELSYENPLGRFGATRLDDRIDFTPETWNLTFLNSNRFNIYPWVAGNRLRSRLPITASWGAWVHAPDRLRARIRYVGEGQVDIGGRTVVLAPAYGQVEQAELDVPAGIDPMLVRYRFDDGSRAGEPVKGPYAVLQVTFLDDGGGVARVKLGPRGGGRGVLRIAAWIGDGLIVGLAMVLIGRCLALLLADWWWIAAIATAWFVTPAPIETAVLPLQTLKIMAAGVVVLLGPLTSAHARRVVGAAYAWVALALALLWPLYRSSEAVVLRTAGSDWLTYESFARSILETGSLQGGENVFYYQALFRYVRFGERVLLGDGDFLVTVSALAALGLSIVWMARRFRRAGRLSLAACTLTGLLMIVVACSAAGALQLIVLGASEYPAWIMLPMLLPRLFVQRSMRAHASGAGLVALSALARFNQLPALLVMLAAFGWRARRRPLHVAVAAAILIAMLLLSPAHNLYYGNRAAYVPTSAGIVENYVLPPDRIVAALHDAEARVALRAQVDHVVARQRLDGDWLLRPALHTLQLLWIVTLAWATLWRRVPLWAALAAITPAVYLAVHVVYQVTVYYPRHILAGHFMMGAATALLVWAAAPRRPPSDNRSA